MSALQHLGVVILFSVGIPLAVLALIEVFGPPLLALMDYPATRRLIDYHNRWWSYWIDKSREWRDR